MQKLNNTVGVQTLTEINELRLGAPRPVLRLSDQHPVGLSSKKLGAHVLTVPKLATVANTPRRICSRCKGKSI